MLFGYRICMQNLQQCGSGSCQIKTRFYKACKFVSSIPECICKAIAAPKHRLGALTHILNGLYFLRTVLRLGGRLFELARTVEQPGTPQHDGYGAHGGGEAEMTRMTEASSSLRSRSPTSVPDRGSASLKQDVRYLRGDSWVEDLGKNRYPNGSS